MNNMISKIKIAFVEMHNCCDLWVTFKDLIDHVRAKIILEPFWSID